MQKRKAKLFFKNATNYVAYNFLKELEWVREIKPFKNIKLKQFLWEYCWTVYASGFNESILEQKFDDIERAFGYFDIQKLSKMKSMKPVLRVFNNRRKARNFIKGVKKIHGEGFSKFKIRVSQDGMNVLQELPGIGQVTKKHLARNIGLSDVAKNDIHIQRLVRHFNARDENQLAEYLSKESGERKGVVDVILWRFCTIKGWKRLGYDTLGDYIQSL